MIQVQAARVWEMLRYCFGLALLALLVSGAQAQVITEYSKGITAGGRPHNIATGTDGNVWFTETVGNRVGKIAPDGTITFLSAENRERGCSLRALQAVVPVLLCVTASQTAST